jgi:hydrogenase maturation protein HypF
MSCAQAIRVRGVVQGVGFRPFVYRLAQANALAGWVFNAEEGVEIHLEGEMAALESFVCDLIAKRPPASQITTIEMEDAEPTGITDFVIRECLHRNAPSVRISPDLPVCDACLDELFDRDNARFGYPYINCTNCGPRYSIILGLPYDRRQTTMNDWPMDEMCSGQYHDPEDRRFHAQPVACPRCGPHYFLTHAGETITGDAQSINETAKLLGAGKIVAIKGIGGYHLACDGRNREAVLALRERKFRKEKPFALMARDLNTARRLVELSNEAEALMTSPARPIVLASAKIELEGVAPDNAELGLMLPYTPLHHLLFAAGAPDVLVMTSANRSSEPIAFIDEDARQQLDGIADAFLAGERPIARRVDDSVARAGVFGPMILRRSRGYSPLAVSQIPTRRPILALGADLKNTVTLVVAGQAFVSQHIGDLDNYHASEAFRQTIDDLVSMYEVSWSDVLVVCDAHPQYASVAHAHSLGGPEMATVQHHRAHVASVLAEREEWNRRVIGVSFDGTGYGDDGAIWGGEIFEGSVESGFRRVAHLRYACLPGGDAAAEHPVQAAAGFLVQIDGLPDFRRSPFCFPARFDASSELVRKSLRTFPTTSMGRLFDTAAALLGYTRSISFEGQAAMWLEQLARRARSVKSYPFPFSEEDLDFRPLLRSVIEDRLRGCDVSEIARAFQRSVAQGVCGTVKAQCEANSTDTVVFSGGVFQNELLLEDIKSLLAPARLEIWTNHAVPPNDGGISLGQAALAASGLGVEGSADAVIRSSAL